MFFGNLGMINQPYTITNQITIACRSCVFQANFSIHLRNISRINDSNLDNLTSPQVQPWIQLRHQWSILQHANQVRAGENTIDYHRHPLRIFGA